MSKYYCRIDDTRGGFFDPAVHGEIGSPDCSIPQGAHEITDEQHAELVAAQSNGKFIVPDPDGYPVAIDPPPPSADEAAATERVWRDLRLAETDSVVTRHRDELESSGSTTLTAEQYIELQDYRRHLRNWPEGAEFPLVDHRPVAPPWLTGSLQ
ncbi:phage tail protein [Pseudomonas sp. 10S4]|uniref:phage tail protein n=1 Tax=Pseudomonas sp. 10S4 TaxID=3048583 RepID=UPI002B23B8C1|nr:MULTISPECIES: phage tail protein [unclassified Pseudomonas]MEB0223592.1 phage tail assembly chaperone [Pseudomonas sp. 5S1]MEB0295715.1 phage tail assembly chaperone [Pseudomonas sp. 10S4]